MFTLRFNPAAAETLARLGLEGGAEAHVRAIKATLGKMQKNLRHPGLHTHKYQGRKCPHGDDLWQSYAQNHRPGAYRVFWCYMPEAERTLLIVAIIPHP